MMSLDQAIRHLRADPQYRDLVRDTYLEPDVWQSASRFAESSEFMEIVRWLDTRLSGAIVVDIGAGRGIASYAFARAGAAKVIAVEPDPSPEVGFGSLSQLQQLSGEERIKIVAGRAEDLPLDRSSVDIVYGRQVLHHTVDPTRAMRECHRVLRTGGRLLMVRDHVADDEDQLRRFLDSHPVHRLAGGENAHPLDIYVGAIEGAGFDLDVVLGPWDCVVNAFPAVRTAHDLREYTRDRVRDRWGTWAAQLLRVPGVEGLVRRQLNRRPLPGRLYSFIATKSR